MLKGNRLIYLNKRGKKKRIKKDYQFKSLNNPFFRSKKKNKDKIKSKKKFFFILVFSLVIIALIYFIFFSNYFKIKKLEISGLERVDDVLLSELVDQQKHSRKWFLFPENNLLIFNTNTLESTINKKIKLESVKITKNLPNTLLISVEERQVAFIWKESGQLFYSDRSGCLIKEPLLEEERLLNYPILTNEFNLSYLDNNNCLSLDSDYFELMFGLHLDLQAYSELKYSYFVLTEERNSLTLDLDPGPKVIFNTKDDLLKQLNKLLAIKQEQSEENFLALEYIDLRFGDLIYFK